MSQIQEFIGGNSHVVIRDGLVTRTPFHPIFAKKDIVAREVELLNSIRHHERQLARITPKITIGKDGITHSYPALSGVSLTHDMVKNESLVKKLIAEISLLHELKNIVPENTNIPTEDEFDGLRSIERFTTNSPVSHLLLVAIRVAINYEAEHSKRCIIHNDYAPGNVLLEDDKITGIIDWSNAIVAHPLREFRQLTLSNPHTAYLISDSINDREYLIALALIRGFVLLQYENSIERQKRYESVEVAFKEITVLSEKKRLKYFCVNYTSVVPDFMNHYYLYDTFISDIPKSGMIDDIGNNIVSLTVPLLYIVENIHNVTLGGFRRHGKNDLVIDIHGQAIELKHSNISNMPTNALDT